MTKKTRKYTVHDRIVWSIEESEESGVFVAHCDAIGLVTEDVGLDETINSIEDSMDLLVKSLTDKKDHKEFFEELKFEEWEPVWEFLKENYT